MSELSSRRRKPIEGSSNHYGLRSPIPPWPFGRRHPILKMMGNPLLLTFLFYIVLTSSVWSQPRSPESPDSLLFREGEIFFSRGEIEKALWRFKSVVTDHPKSPLFNEAKFRMALCYTQLKRHKEAIRTLHELLPTFMAPLRMFQVFTLLGDNYLELKEYHQTLLWYGKGLRISGQPHDELRKKIRAIIDTLETEEDLNQVEMAHRGAYAGGYAKLKLAQMAKKMGQEAIAKKMFSEMEKEYFQMDYMSQLKERVESISPVKKSKYVVGILLPLSGIHMPFGEKALQAIRLAFKEKEGSEKGPLVSLAIRDSKGNEFEAERAVEELIKVEKVIAIIGPLLSLTVDRTARKAQQLKVPLITLSQRDPSIGRGDFVFQNSLTPLNQVQTLVAFATEGLKLRTFAVFYPNSPYGLHFKNLFSQEVVRKGGKMIGSVVYQEGQTDFRQEIKGFFKVEALHRPGEGKKKEEEFRQGLFVDGLFIPDTHDRVGILLSQMDYYDITGMIPLGTNAWNGPDLIRIAGKGAEGAIFVDAFSKGPSLRNFIVDFQKEYQREPETLEAICYDGAKLLKEILQTRSPSTPAELREELKRLTSYQGVSGLKGFGEDGKAIRTLSLLRVNHGKIELVSP